MERNKKRIPKNVHVAYVRQTAGLSSLYRELLRQAEETTSGDPTYDRLNLEQRRLQVELCDHCSSVVEDLDKKGSP